MRVKFEEDYVTLSMLGRKPGVFFGVGPAKAVKIAKKVVEGLQIIRGDARVYMVTNKHGETKRVREALEGLPEHFCRTTMDELGNQTLLCWRRYVVPISSTNTMVRWKRIPAWAVRSSRRKLKFMDDPYQLTVTLTGKKAGQLRKKRRRAFSSWREKEVPLTK